MSKRNYLTKLPRSLHSANFVLHNNYKAYMEAQKSKNPICWVDVNFPSFLLWAMDVTTIFPQMHSAFQAQRKSVKKMMHELESKHEIPHTICGEVKGLIGCAIYHDNSAFHIPDPDFLVTANTSCNIVSKGFRYTAQYFQKDLLFADFPFSYGEVTKEMIDYSTAQVFDVIHDVERRTGRKLTYEKAFEWTENIMILFRIWEDICKINTSKPAPVDALDLYLFSSIMVTVPSHEKVVQLFINLYNELKAQEKANLKVDANEKFRILWHFLPIYSEKKYFQKMFDQNHISVASASFFPNPADWFEAWEYEFTYPLTMDQVDGARKKLRDSGDLGGNLEELVRIVVEGLLKMDVNTSINQKEQTLRTLIESFDIDGVVMHADRSCRTQTLPMHELKNRLSADLNMPVLLFDSDSMDERFFAPSQITTRFEAFVEMLNMKKSQ